MVLLRIWGQLAFDSLKFFFKYGQGLDSTKRVPYQEKNHIQWSLQTKDTLGSSNVLSYGNGTLKSVLYR